MGLLDALSGGLTAATTAASAQQQGQMQGSQLLRAMMMQQAQLAKEQAETKLAGEHANYFHRESATPRLGDPNYNDAKAGEAGAVAAATEPIHTQGAINTAAGVAPIHTQQAIATARGVEPIHTQGAINTAAGTAPIKVNEATQIAENTGKIGLQAGKQFVSANKSLTDAIQPYALAKDMLRAAKSGNPAALKSATMAFAGVADPKARLTQGVINMISQVDPSVQGRLDLAMDRLASGKLPPRVIDDIERIVDQVHQTHRAMYDQRRKAAIARQPQVEQAIPTTEELFDVPGYSGGSAPSAPTTHPVVSKYGITPVRP
jgi:hypothetical protein